MKRILCLTIIGLLAGGCQDQSPSASNIKAAQGHGSVSAEVLESVAEFSGAMPTGVTVSREGRIFVNFPRWGDEVPFTVAEVKDGKAVAYPSPEINQIDMQRAADTLISVQSVVVDSSDRLWILDTGSISMGPTVQGGPKLICVDLKNDQVIKKIQLPQTVALQTSYLNDVRFDLRRGKSGMAYITDSSSSGPNGIIVVDLDWGRSWRRLSDHPSTKAEVGFAPTVEGQSLMVRPDGKLPKPLNVGSDGIAISNDGSRLYYSPLCSRKLYSVSTEALITESVSDAQVEATVKFEGPKPASDGLESDAQGRIYTTDYEHNSVHRRNINGTWDTLVQDARLIWPDTLSLASDGYMYVMANQLNRQAQYHEGNDLRVKPYCLYRFKVDATPVLLK